MELDRAIVNVLADYPIIWDRSRKDFRDNRKKENAFRNIATMLNQPVEVIMSRYKAIREKYRKEKMRMDECIRSGVPIRDVDIWELYSSLSFLDNVILPRKRTNYVVDYIPKPKNQEYENKQASASSNIIDFVEESNELPNIKVEPDEQTENYEYELMLSPTPSETLSLKVSPPSSSVGSTIPKVRKKKKQQGSDEKLSTQQPLPARLGKFHWLGKFIAASLSEMDSETANQKVVEIVQILNKRS